MRPTASTLRRRPAPAGFKPNQVYLPPQLYQRLWHYILTEQARGSVESMAGWVRRLILENLPEEE